MIVLVDASVADALVIAAPTTLHATTKKEVGPHSYQVKARWPCSCSAATMHLCASLWSTAWCHGSQMRMWCRAEQFCYAVHNGAKNMFLATSTAPPIAVDNEWLNTGLMVFEGELTCCAMKHVFNGNAQQCDRTSLLRPILGLYGELYATRLLQDAARANDAKTGFEGALTKPHAKPHSTGPGSAARLLRHGAGSSGDVSRKAALKTEETAASDDLMVCCCTPHATPAPTGCQLTHSGAHTLTQTARAPSRGRVLHCLRLQSWLDGPRKERMFPRTFKMVTPKRTSTVELFGELISKIEFRQQLVLAKGGDAVAALTKAAAPSGPQHGAVIAAASGIAAQLGLANLGTARAITRSGSGSGWRPFTSTRSRSLDLSTVATTGTAP